MAAFDGQYSRLERAGFQQGAERVGAGAVNNRTGILCPSARMKEGGTLLGIVMPNGRVAFSPDRIEVNREFVVNANEGRSPEKRF